MDFCPISRGSHTFLLQPASLCWSFVVYETEVKFCITLLTSKHSGFDIIHIKRWISSIPLPHGGPPEVIRLCTSVCSMSIYDDTPAITLSDYVKAIHKHIISLCQIMWKPFINMSYSSWLFGRWSMSCRYRYSNNLNTTFFIFQKCCTFFYNNTNYHRAKMILFYVSYNFIETFH